ncbi:MAG: 5-(carboxyamino)imidazole ribonucleotide synthase [Pseudomonadota bacterium]
MPHDDALSPPLVPPGGAVGVLGGGQLGRMLAGAAAQLGLKTIIYAPETDSPAADCAADTIFAAYDDEVALKRFAESVDVVTLEFENVPVKTLKTLERFGAIVAPGPKALEAAQDRAAEKTLFQSLGAATAPWRLVDNLEDLNAALRDIGTPSILKTRRFGYDGKGQARLDEETEPASAWAAVGASPAILEGFVDFEMEISVIAARGRDGAVAVYDMPRNIHADGILQKSIVPGGRLKDAESAARDIAQKTLAALDYIGVLAIEFFVAKEGGLIVNEFAPRVHNTGHWTLDACAVSQFQQHIRAVCGWPLGAPSRFADAEMENLIGAQADQWRNLAAQPDAALHLYGKAEARPGRKMGHITRLAPLGSKTQTN